MIPPVLHARWHDQKTITELANRLNQHTDNASKPPSSDGAGSTPPARPRTTCGQKRGLDNPEGGVGERQYTFGMHVLPEYVINVVENAFVITLSASQLGISGSRTQFIPQTPRSYERMAKAIIGAG
ncbi:hypothetical protein BJD16_00105 [Aeromonas sobria]|uniref:Uncharacterized protein n=1 Tax=Aeromonas sobria TaxID=646 RepID=A0A1S2D746_AERSO|nr:hypothetical protein BJD16_00105 [Aeromonas sobria]